MLFPLLLGSLALTLCLAGLFCGAGWAAQAWLGLAPRKPYPPALATGLHYFAGAGLFLALWKIADAGWKNARASLAVALVLLLVLVLSRFGELRRLLATWWGYGTAAGWFALVWLFVFLFWLAAVRELVPHSNAGSQAAAKYGNIALYVIDQNYLPILGQHHGQSLLAAAASLLSWEIPYAHLNSFLAVSMYFWVLVCYGFLAWLGLSLAMARWGAFLWLAANSSLSLVHVNVYDSGSPPLLIGNTDTVLAIGTLVGFLLWMVRQVEAPSPWWALLGGAFLWSASWNMSGSQNIPVCVAAVGFLWVVQRYRTGRWDGRLAMACAALGAALAITAPTGGMLTPKRLQERPQLAMLQDIANMRLAADPQMPYVVQGVVRWEWWSEFSPHAGLQQDMQDIREKWQQSRSEALWMIRGFALKAWYTLESQLWIAVRVLFFPLLALGLHYFWLRGRYTALAPPEALSWLGSLTLGMTLAGFVPVFLLSIEGYKWETSRLLIPGYTLGGALLVCVAGEAAARYPRWLGRWSRAGLAVVLTLGPFTTMVFKILFNLYFALGSHQPKTADLLLHRGYVNFRPGAESLNMGEDLPPSPNQ